MSPPHVIAVDLGGTKIATGLVDREGGVSRRLAAPTALSSEEDLLAQLERAIAELGAEGFAGLGVGVHFDKFALRSVRGRYSRFDKWR